MPTTPLISQIVLFGGNFAPRGWAFCHGQLLPISGNSALFSLVGTIYGGDGRTTFGLPDLRGRVPLQYGNGPGLSDRRQGVKAGANAVTLVTANLPAHNHVVEIGCKNAGGDSTSPVGRHYAVPPEGDAYVNAVNADELMGATTSGLTGGSQSHTNHQPSLGLNYIIALTGVFPSRN